MSGWVAAAGQPVVNSDARLDLDEADRDASPLRSALAVPVEAGGAVIAVLTFYARPPGAVSEPHHRLAQAAAHAIAGCGLADLAAAERQLPVQKRHTAVRS